MKKIYIIPQTEELLTIASDLMKVYGPASMPEGPISGSAPARRISVLGGIGGGAGVGSLGSVGHVR